MSVPKLFVIALCSAAIIMMAFVGTTSAATYPHSPFVYTGNGGTYVGTCTTNITDSHFINTCHATFVPGSGAKVSQTTMLDGPNLHGVINPSGQMTEVVNLDL